MKKQLFKKIKFEKIKKRLEKINKKIIIKKKKVIKNQRTKKLVKRK